MFVLRKKKCMLKKKRTPIFCIQLGERRSYLYLNLCLTKINARIVSLIVDISTRTKQIRQGDEMKMINIPPVALTCLSLVFSLGNREKHVVNQMLDICSTLHSNKSRLPMCIIFTKKFSSIDMYVEFYANTHSNLRLE